MPLNLLELGGAMGWMDTYPEDEAMMMESFRESVMSASGNSSSSSSSSSATINMCGGRGHFLERSSALRSCREAGVRRDRREEERGITRPSGVVWCVVPFAATCYCAVCCVLCALCTVCCVLHANTCMTLLLPSSFFLLPSGGGDGESTFAFHTTPWCDVGGLGP